MKVIISGQHMDVGDAMRLHIEESVSSHVTKYFESATQANVSIVKEKDHLFKTDILVYDGTGKNHVLNASNSDSEPYKSFDVAVQKLNKQLRRYKGKLQKQRAKKKEDNLLYDITDYVIEPTSEDQEVSTSDEAPVIIAQKQTQVKKLSVSDAVMHMDLLDLPALIFVNSSNNRFNMVYYRKDGNISWVDVPAEVK